jgi:hypothetical protein
MIQFYYFVLFQLSQLIDEHLLADSRHGFLHQAESVAFFGNSIHDQYFPFAADPIYTWVTGQL